MRVLRTDANVAVGLADLAARYGSDVLIMVGDGGLLYDSAAAEPHSWLADLEGWRLVVLFTPTPRRRWSWRERRLTELGVLVLPATSGGLETLGNYLRTGGRRPAPALERRPVRPGPIVAEGLGSARWHSDAIPPTTERESVLDAIALEVPGPAFDLIGVLAIFPELRPDLTFYAANQLRGPDEGSLVDEAGSLRACLHCRGSRVGRMPDWLRLELGRTVPPDRADEARTMFAEWLTPLASPAPLGAAVEITVDTLADIAAHSAARGGAAPGRRRDLLALSAIGKASPSSISKHLRRWSDRIKERLARRPPWSLIVAALCRLRLYCWSQCSQLR